MQNQRPSSWWNNIYHLRRWNKRWIFRYMSACEHCALYSLPVARENADGLGINIVVPPSQLELLFQCAIRRRPPDVIPSGEVLRRPFGTALVVVNPTTDFSWMLTLLPMPPEAQCFLGQLRLALVVEETVQGFKLGSIPCLTANSQAELK